MDSPAQPSGISSGSGGVAEYARIFFRGFSIVTLTAMNTVQIAAMDNLGAYAVGFGISWVWFTNARAAAHTDLPHAREVYALGAACGTVVGMNVAAFLHRVRQ
jgi:hypothetical protein